MLIEGQSSLPEVNILGMACVFCMMKHFVRYCLHSKAHALPFATISTWAVPVFGFLLVDSVKFPSPIHIFWNLNNLFQVMFMLWSVHLVQPTESFVITQAGRLCVKKVIFPFPTPFYYYSGVIIPTFFPR